MDVIYCKLQKKTTSIVFMCCYGLWTNEDATVNQYALQTCKCEV